MNITLTGTKITQDNKFLAFEKNNGVDVINITVDTDESWTYKLDVKYPEKCCSGEALYNIINLTRNGNVCTAILTSDMLPFSGKYTMQIRGINGDKVTHSDVFDCWVKYSIEPASTYDPVPSEFYQIEANVTEMNNNPPYPSNDGYWMIWDVNTHAYKKSDIKIIDGLPEISESTKDMALYNDGEKAEWREQRNPIPDYQENDPESPNYIRNRNGGYYTWDEENPIGYYLVINGKIYNNRFRLPNGFFTSTTMLYIAIKRGDTLSAFFKPRAYFEAEENASELGFYLSNYNDSIKECTVNYIPSPTDITDIKMYAVEPHTWPSDLLPIAAYNTPGSVSISSLTKTNEYGDNAIRYFSDSHTNEDGTLYTEKYFINIDDFEWSESSGAPDFHYQTVERGWILKSSNYLAGVLGLGSADFPIRIISTNTVYGSGIPYLNCQFFTKTGKSGYFNWRANGKAENAVLNATGGDSDIFVVRFTQNDNTWSADKTYAEIKQAIDDGKVVQGVVYNNFIGIGILHGGIVIFQFNASSFDLDSGIYGLKTLVIIVKADGITVYDSLDEPWGEYHDAILPSQVLLVTNAGGNISAKLGALGEGGSPLTYLISYNALNTFPVLTALYLAPNVAPERFYFSSVVTTPDSATSSAKADFVFKSADATKTLTGSVTKPNDWDGETPLAETWTYEEISPFIFKCNTPPTLGTGTQITQLNDQTLKPMIDMFGRSDDDVRAKSYNPFSAIVYTQGYECVCLDLTDFDINGQDGRVYATFAGSVDKTKNATLWLSASLTDTSYEIVGAQYIEADPLDGAVRYDKTQSLTDAQKQQARDNIGVVDVPTPSAENVGKIPVSKQVGDGYKYVMEDKSTSDLSLGLTGTQIGQIAKITAVDTNGKPTAWEPVDLPTGGGGEAIDIAWKHIRDVELAPDIIEAIVSTTDAGDAFSYDEIIMEFIPNLEGYFYVRASQNALYSKSVQVWVTNSKYSQIHLGLLNKKIAITSAFRTDGSLVFSNNYGGNGDIDKISMLVFGASSAVGAAFTVKIWGR